VHRAEELDHLALEEIDPLGRLLALAEYLCLDHLDVVLDALGDRVVVVDHLVEDGPYDRGRAQLEQLGSLLQPLAGRAELACLAVAHRDHVVAGGEQVHLAEVDPLSLLVVARGLQDDEVGVLVVLQLRPLVGALRVLDRQLVQVEALRHLVKLLGAGLMQPQPDELARLAGDALRCVLQRQLSLVLALAVFVVGAVDDHRVVPDRV